MSKNRSWGVYGDKHDLDDQWEGYAKYERNLLEFGAVNDCDQEPRDGLFDEDGDLLKDKWNRAGYGCEEGW